MDFFGTAKKLDDDDIRRIALELACDEAAIRALAEVESAGGGFLRDRRPKILFEAHVFGQLTDHAFTRSHPHLSSRRWRKELYGRGGAHQYTRLEEAMTLNANAALSSASWGMFQVMGFNFERAGHSSLRAFVEAMKRSEGDHLDAMIAFVKHRRLDEALRSHDWAGFACGYNGSGYRENQYDVKLERAWKKHAAPGASPTLSLRQVQVRLNRAGARPQLAEDGVMGPKTRKAIRAFQHARGLVVDGKLGPLTRAALLRV